MTDGSDYEYPMFDDCTDALEVGFIDNMVISLKRMVSFHVLFGIIGAIISLVLLVYLVDYLNESLTDVGTSISLPLMALLMLSIPAWTLSFANGVSVQKRRKLNASGTAGILGRYVGAVIAAVAIMTFIYFAVFVTWYTIKGDTDLNLTNSYLIMVSFVALASAMTLFFNTIYRRGSTVAYLVLFLLIPILAFILGPLSGLLTLDQASTILPLVDSISSVAADGFGGGTVLTLTILLKSSPPLSPDVMGTVALTLGWAVLFLALTIVSQYSREAEHDKH